MRVYHTTNAGEAILLEGFKDGEGSYGTGIFWCGTWVADRPVDCNEGAKGKTVLTLEIPEEIFVQNEWINEGAEEINYRESLIPAELLNSYGKPRICTEEELDAELEKRFVRNEQILQSLQA